MQLPDLESLRCFCAAATHLNFRRAAKEVGLSPAAFSDRMRRLEEQFDQALFERSTRSVVLTVEGHRLVPHARELLRMASDCRAVLDRQAPYALTIGTRYELGLSWLVPALPSLQAETPERTLHLFFSSGPDLMNALGQSHIDAMVSSMRLTQAFDAHPLHVETYEIVGERRLLERVPFRSQKDASRHTLVDSNPDLPLFRYFVDALEKRSLWDFQAVEHMGTIAAIRARILQGAGVGVLPTYFVADDLERGRLVRLFPRTSLRTDEFRLVWRASDRRRDQFVALGEALAQVPLA